MKDLRVDLAAFQGPLDLLLHLVQQEEVDIYEISIARIADRFLEVCRSQVHGLDVDQAGEFLVMASQLLVLKSRALLPRDEEADLEEIDPRLDLVRQLLEYRRFKGASAELEERFEQQRLKTPVRLRRPAAAPLEDEELELDLFGLVDAFQRLLRETGEDESVAMPKERLPITHFVGQIFDELTAVGGRTGFRALIGRGGDRTYVIGAFLALLELIKLRKVRVFQDGLGDIQIEIREDALLPEGEGDDAAARAIDRPDVAEEEARGPRIVFMGSPAFAVPALRSLVGAGLTPRLVVTPPPRRAGRGRRAQAVPLAREAEGLEIPLHRTNDVNGRTSRDEIAAVRPDVIVTAGFGQKLGSGILEMAEHGCLNLHASLLPRHRGASPVAAAIREGDAQTGVTLFRMDEAIDHGPILGQRAVDVEPAETCERLTARLAEEAADLLVRTLPRWLAGEIEPRPQDDEAATYARRLTKEDGVVDWSQPAERVRNHIRSVTAWPGARTAWQPRVRHDPLPLVLLEAEVLAEPQPQAPTGEEVRPGTVLAVGPEGLDVACGEGVLRVKGVRPAGGRAMAVKDFLNARRVVAGDRLVAPRPEEASVRSPG